MSKDRNWKIVRHGGDGKTRVEGSATTAAKAREIANAEKNQLLQGSSDWFTVVERY